MTQDSIQARLERLRQDLAALRADGAIRGAEDRPSTRTGTPSAGGASGRPPAPVADALDPSERDLVTSADVATITEEPPSAPDAAEAEPGATAAGEVSADLEPPATNDTRSGTDPSEMEATQDLSPVEVDADPQPTAADEHQPEPEASPADASLPTTDRPDHEPAAATAEQRQPPAPEEPSPAVDTRVTETASARGRSRRRRRPKAPKPPRRSLFRRRAIPPPRRLAVPQPIPVTRRPTYVAAPRWSRWTLFAGVVTTLVLLPISLQMLFRVFTAMTETSVLLGADPSPADFLRASAGVSGGALTAAPALVAVGLARGRMGWIGGAVGVLVVFGIFPAFTYSANAGILSASAPTFSAMLTPTGWGYEQALVWTFVLSCVALGMAVLDLIYRSGAALRAAYVERRDALS